MEFCKYSDEEFEALFMSIINPVNSMKVSSYKFAFARFLIEHSYNSNNTHVTFDEISYYFLKYYWTQECRSKLVQSIRYPKSNGEYKEPAIITIIRDEFGTLVYPDSFNEIEKKHPEKIQNCKNKIKKSVFGDVTYAFQRIGHGDQMKDLHGVFFTFDYTKEKIRPKHSMNKPIIDISKGITLNPYAKNYFVKYNSTLYKTVILEWVRFLENYNLGVPKLVDKVEGIIEKRSNLSKQSKILYSYFKKCFYCKILLNAKNDPDNSSQDKHVEHVIPFSFMREDEMWNFVLACKKCNCKKLASLPPEIFLDELFSMHEKFQDKIPELKYSLNKLGKDPQTEIRNHYSRSKKLGFLVLDDFLNFRVKNYSNA